MEQGRFSALTRSVGARRAALAGLAAFVAAAAIPAADGETRRKNKKRVYCHRRYIKCGKRCIDAYNDPEHCGGCKTRCDTGVDCVLGVCGGTA